MCIYYNPLDTACKSVIGGVKQNMRVQFRVYCLRHDTQNARQGEFEPPKTDGFFLLRKDGAEAIAYPMQKTEYGWSITLKIAEIGLYFYSFKVGDATFISCDDNEMGYCSEQIREFVLTVYSNKYTTPDWFKGGVMYQIFPDRFAKSGAMPDITGRICREDWGGLPSFRPNEYGKVLNNDFFGGNFKGIIEKLPYLKALGVTVIYLNPIFEATSNHRYDTANYLKIDPYLGTEMDFKQFIHAAKNQGIRVILDGVFNHTGDNSVYFNKYGNFDSLGAYQSKDSPYADWYTFTQFPEKYESWWGIDVLPEVNEQSISYQKYIFEEGGVLKTWLDYGIGGYRLDVADELPDFFLEKLRKSVKESNENAIIIGEVWEDASTKVAYSKRRVYLQGNELDSVMNYPWKNAIISYILSGNPTELLQSIRMILNRYPKQSVDCLMNILGTHDTPRILTVLGGKICHNKEEMATESALMRDYEKDAAIEKLKMAAVLQFTLPGVPCIYYGDENAMEGHIDPFCRKCFDWMHLHEHLISFYQKLGTMRCEQQNILKDGAFELLETDGGLIVFARKNANSELTVYINNSSKRHILELPYKMREYISDQIFENTMQIEPNSYGILSKVK